MMRRVRRLTLLMLPLLLLAQARGSTTERLDPGTIFEEAQKAYDEGQVEEALLIYEGLQKEQFYNSAIFFNMGNAYFKRGDLGRAVLNYRRALYEEPMDADIRGNYNFALQQAGAEAPMVSPPVALFFSLTHRQWASVAVVGYWLLFGAIAALILFKEKRDLWIKFIWVSLMVLALGIAGRLHWNGLHHRPEWVAISEGQQALYAPVSGAKIHFDLPPGSVVRQEELKEDWVRVSLGKKSGWIKQKHFAKVYPWN